jgi:hypothetical protein
MRCPWIDTRRLLCPQSHRQHSWNECKTDLGTVASALGLRPRTSNELILFNHTLWPDASVV